jgi:hypothetical protein
MRPHSAIRGTVAISDTIGIIRVRWSTSQIPLPLGSTMSPLQLHRPVAIRFVAWCLIFLFCDFGTRCFAQDAGATVATTVDLGGDAELELIALKRALQIRTISGNFQLADKANSIRLRLDFYRNGEPIPMKKSEPGVGGQEGRRYGRFDVQIVDLDYLKLGDARPGHWRIFFNVMTSDEPKGRGTTASSKLDVAKNAFDANPSTGAIGRFEDFPPSDDGSIPIFYSASGPVKRAGTLAKLLEANLKADVLVGVLITR